MTVDFTSKKQLITIKCKHVKGGGGMLVLFFFAESDRTEAISKIFNHMKFSAPKCDSLFGYQLQIPYNDFNYSIGA